jgi:5-methylcytosine-specific restriction endonuclease McrA
VSEVYHQLTLVSDKSTATPLCICESCGKAFVPRHSKNANRFCSRACFGQWLSATRKGDGNPAWQGGGITKVCEHCGKEFRVLTKHRDQRFCSHLCHGAANRGEHHPMWTGNAKPEESRTPKGDRGRYHRWRDAVKDRDNYTCQRCGTTEGRMHSHHIKGWRDHPELRYDVANGITLCPVCHGRLHTDEQFHEKRNTT